MAGMNIKVVKPERCGYMARHRQITVVEERNILSLAYMYIVYYHFIVKILFCVISSRCC